MTSESDNETQVLAEMLAATMKGGEVIALVGDLGAGKTTFVKGFAHGLGIAETVTSPTFVLMNVYDVERDSIAHFAHIDCYRLDSSSQLEDIGVSDYLAEAHSVTAIEWPERAKNLLPASTIWITFEIGTQPN